jgi:hypothetical protein
MKVNHKLQLIAVFMGMLMLTACGGGNDSKPVTPPPPPPVSQSLDGLWSTRCSASNNLAGYDEQDTFNFKGNTLTTTKFFYQQDTNCKHSDEVLRARITASIALGKEVNLGTDTGHTKIDITPKQVTLSPANDTFTTSFNDASYTGNGSIYYGYGLKEWSIYYKKIISGFDVAITNFKINQIEPEIFQISEDMVDGATRKVLKLGSKAGNVDSDGRPISIANSNTAMRAIKTTQAQTAQNAGLTGTWKYSCRKGKGDAVVQNSTLNFIGTTLIETISFYYSTKIDTGCKLSPRFQVKIEADIVPGKVINAGGANEHTLIGLKITKVEVNPMNMDYVDFLNNRLGNNLSSIFLYKTYGQTDWKLNTWKNISNIPDSIERIHIGTEMPDIFKISTVTTGNVTHTVLKRGDYLGSFDIDGRPLSLEPEGAVRQ